MIYAVLIFAGIVLFAWYIEYVNGNWRQMLQMILGQSSKLEDQIREERTESQAQRDNNVAVRVEHAKALGVIEEMQKGRQFDQTLLNNSLERTERFKRVLEAVLRQNGCDDAQIALVLTKAENDKDLDDGNR